MQEGRQSLIVNESVFGEAIAIPLRLMQERTVVAIHCVAHVASSSSSNSHSAAEHTQGYLSPPEQRQVRHMHASSLLGTRQPLISP